MARTADWQPYPDGNARECVTPECGALTLRRLFLWSHGSLDAACVDHATDEEVNRRLQEKDLQRRLGEEEKP